MTTWTFNKGGFSIAMPGEPVYQPTQVNSMILNVWRLTNEAGQTYTVAYAEHSEVDLMAEAQAFIRGFQGRVIQEGTFEINGRSARFAFGENSTSRFYYYNTSAGNRVYQWVFVTPLNTPIGSEAQQFVDSFKLH